MNALDQKPEAPAGISFGNSILPRIFNVESEVSVNFAHISELKSLFDPVDLIEL